jgi:putative colanic acid biosynthesis glycosyltransferase
MTEPFFSVITIVRNELPGLRATQKTLEAQTFMDWEWVIVDGASTDGTAEAVLALDDSRIRAKSERDKGIFDAMNKGVRRATGEYVVLMNAGDLFAGDTVLAEAAAELRSHPVDVLFGGSIMRFGGRIDVRRPVRRPSYIWHGQPGLHQATFFRRAVHVDYEYNVAFPITADYEIMARMWADGRSFRSFPIMVSINAIESKANSTKNKTALIKEAAVIQRRILGHSLAKTAASVAYRTLTSSVAKALTLVSERDAVPKKRT